MTNAREDQVRPTKRCLDDIGLSFPSLDLPLSCLDHPLVKRAQEIPAKADWGGCEPVRVLSDRIWFKCKTSGHRGVVTCLTLAERQQRKLLPSAAWWMGAAGKRQADSASDFYKLIEAEAKRAGKGTGHPSTSHLLPKEIDRQRLEAETAALAIQSIRNLVLSLIAHSLSDGHPYSAEIRGHRVAALVLASGDSEAYLAISAEGFLSHELIAIFLDAVPGIRRDDWQPEPGGVAGIEPIPGQVIWSAIIPPDAQADILSRASGD